MREAQSCELIVSLFCCYHCGMRRGNYTKRVGLLLSTRLQFDRDVIRGFLRYADSFTSWLIYPTPWDIPPGIPPCDAIVMRGHAKLDDALAALPSGGPLVAVTGAPTPCARVWTHDFHVGERIGSYFADRGYTQAIFPSAPYIECFAERARGFSEAFKGDGRVLHQPKVPPLVSKEPHWGKLAKLIRTVPKPAAFISPSIDGARIALYECQSAGVTVPDEMALMACDYDELISHTCNPRISGIDLRGEVIGHAAAELLDRLLTGSRDPDDHTPVLVEPGRIITHGSAQADAIQEPLVRKAMAFIDAHAKEAISVTDIAADAGVHHRTLERAFLREIGKGPKRLLREVRLHCAFELLMTTALKITDIATQCGYCHVGQLAAHFKSTYGCTPRAYRDKHSVTASPRG
jgi:LacI family transcriptional regulator